MQRPKGRVLRLGEMIANGDLYRVTPTRWVPAYDVGLTVPAILAGCYIRPEPVTMNAPEPAPTDGEGPAIWSLVVEDMKERDAFGRDKYGKPLRAADGRKTLRDAYQEALDLVVYLRKAIYESEGR